MRRIEVGFEGGELIAFIPSPVEGREQTLRIPATAEGVRILRRIVSSEGHLSYGKKLGTAAEPTQALVDAWLRADREAKISAAIMPEVELELDL